MSACLSNWGWTEIEQIVWAEPTCEFGCTRRHSSDFHCLSSSPLAFSLLCGLHYLHWFSRAEECNRSRNRNRNENGNENENVVSQQDPTANMKMCCCSCWLPFLWTVFKIYLLPNTSTTTITLSLRPPQLRGSKLVNKLPKSLPLILSSTRHRLPPMSRSLCCHYHRRQQALAFGCHCWRKPWRKRPSAC